MNAKDEWQPTSTRVPTPFSSYELDGVRYWRSPDVLLSNAAGEYAIGFAELIGPWEMVDGQMVGHEGAETIWGTDSVVGDFEPDLWLPLPVRPNGTLVRGDKITLASVSMYLKTIGATPPCA